MLVFRDDGKHQAGSALTCKNAHILRLFLQVMPKTDGGRQAVNLSMKVLIAELLSGGGGINEQLQSPLLHQVHCMRARLGVNVNVPWHSTGRRLRFTNCSVRLPYGGPW
jgi:hypothetical protein